jgi:hypothetical protein
MSCNAGFLCRYDFDIAPFERAFEAFGTFVSDHSVLIALALCLLFGRMFYLAWTE